MLEDSASWQDADGEWALAFQYCKSLLRFGLTREMCTRLVSEATRASAYYDSMKVKCDEEKRRRRKQKSAAKAFTIPMHMSLKMKKWHHTARRNNTLQQTLSEGSRQSKSGRRFSASSLLDSGERASD